jgi:predicted permease
MVLQHLFPVFALILLGLILKQRGMTDEAFLATTDRLIYYIFFPAMLFWKIGTADQRYAAQAVPLFMAAACAVGVVYVLSALYIWAFKVPAFQAGGFSQSCYRFNTSRVLKKTTPPDRQRRGFAGWGG